MTGAANLALATLAFVGTHFGLSHPLRLPLVQNMGEAAFQLLYSLVAILTFGWIVLAYRATPAGLPLWVAPGWAWPVAAAVMLVAAILFVGSLSGNPALPFRGARRRAAAVPTGVLAITRHPMNLSFVLWALVHLALWGEMRNVIVALGILVLAVGGTIGQERKKRATLGPAWAAWEARTSFVPFGALVSGRLPWRSAAPGWIALGGGLAVWLLATWLHAPSVSPIVLLLGT
ncbi:MFS transporter [Sphingomonas parva]|uniref:MFS transporter n=1 Tax=Sphingomonas parva TaxID=2555898 RepID=A0A4Y8ZR05_9SPHN|nr:NnrU family protein [Sphingomonas parva]TFI56826.1 MFS transporter [Sphingomonas parva]